MSESMTTPTDICANCGKDNATNICNKCKMIKYCNAACKKKHRHKHKQDCEEHVKRAAELRDKELFKQPPPQYEDCPICFLLMPSMSTGYKYMSCCRKVICSGCVHATKGLTVDQLCPFCRAPSPKGKEMREMAEKCVCSETEINDCHLIYSLGIWYMNGEFGFPQDHTKALEYFHRAGELGFASGFYNVGYVYFNGNGVQCDMKKAVYYWELAAMMGDVDARYILGKEEKKEGNMDRALKHYMIAVRSGHIGSLEEIKQFFVKGHATKDDYGTAIRAHQSYLNEIKSIPRDEAAVHDDNYKYC